MYRPSKPSAVPFNECNPAKQLCPLSFPQSPLLSKEGAPLRPPNSSSEEWVLQLGFYLGLAKLPRGSCRWVGCPRHLPALPASPLLASQRAERLAPLSWTQVQLRNPVLWREKELPGAPGKEGPVGSRESRALKEGATLSPHGPARANQGALPSGPCGSGPGGS